MGDGATYFMSGTAEQIIVFGLYLRDFNFNIKFFTDLIFTQITKFIILSFSIHNLARFIDVLI